MSDNKRKVVIVTHSDVSHSLPNFPVMKNSTPKEFLQKTPIVKVNSQNWKVGSPNPYR